MSKSPHLERYSQSSTFSSKVVQLSAKPGDTSTAIRFGARFIGYKADPEIAEVFVARANEMKWTPEEAVRNFNT